MMPTFKNALCSVALVAAVVAGSSAAHATVFGNASGSITAAYNPVVTSSTVDLSNGTPTLFSGTGQLNPPVTAPITVTGVFNYSQTVGTTVTNALSSFMTFSDGGSGTDIFDLASVLTTAYVGGSNQSIALYLLGNLSDPTAGFAASATSITMTLNNNQSGPFTYSATLSDPPAPPPGVPEPASLLVLGAGLAGLGLVRRRKV